MPRIERFQNMSHFESKKHSASPLQIEQKKRMFAAGFTRFEITRTLLFREKNGAEIVQKQFDNPKWAKAFEDALATRDRFTRHQIELGLTRDEIRAKFNKEEKIKEEAPLDPYVFLRDEYRQGIKRKADFGTGIARWKEAKDKANEFAKRKFGTNYKR